VQNVKEKPTNVRLKDCGGAPRWNKSYHHHHHYSACTISA